MLAACRVWLGGLLLSSRECGGKAEVERWRSDVEGPCGVLVAGVAKPELQQGWAGAAWGTEFKFPCRSHGNPLLDLSFKPQPLK